jgi:DNA-binding MarR family transcriptional regulator
MLPDDDIPALADRLHSAAIHLLRGVRREDAAAGIPPAQLSALSVLVFGGPLALGRLAAVEQVRPPTMSRIVSSLERAGLVTREPHPSDARSSLVTATAEGRALLVAGRRRRAGVLETRLRELAPEQLDALRRAAAALETISRGEANARRH